MELKPVSGRREGGGEDDNVGKRHFHVLAVDDSMVDRKLLERLLGSVSSYQVTFVDSGGEALQYLGLDDDGNNFHDNNDDDSASLSPPPSIHEGEKKVNLIMTDYCMPGINGYDLLRRVKGSSWKDVPVVMMSSENEPSRISMCMEGGAHDFLLKPLKPWDLERIQTFLLNYVPSRNKPMINGEGNDGDNSKDENWKDDKKSEENVKNCFQEEGGVVP